MALINRNKNVLAHHMHGYYQCFCCAPPGIPLQRKQKVMQLPRKSFEIPPSPPTQERGRRRNYPASNTHSRLWIASWYKTRRTAENGVRGTGRAAVPLIRNNNSGTLLWPCLSVIGYPSTGQRTNVFVKLRHYNPAHHFWLVNRSAIS